MKSDDEVGGASELRVFTLEAQERVTVLRI